MSIKEMNHIKQNIENPGILKIRLLTEGVLFDDSVFTREQSYLEKRYYFGNSDEQLGNAKRPPQEILLHNGQIVVGVNQRSNTPWIVKYSENDGYFLTYNGEKVTSIDIPAYPEYYDKKLSNGKLAKEVLSIYGSYILSGFIRGHCDFFNKKEQCKFCNLNPTRKEIQDGVFIIDEEAIREAADLAFKYDSDKISCLMYCGGSHYDRDKEVQNYIKLSKAVNSANIDRTLHQHVLCAPPKDFNLYHELKESGIDTVGHAFEIYDRDLFHEICPGKAKYIGYDHFFPAYEHAVKEFGKGRIYSVFVGGLEPLDSMLEGFDVLSEMGVVPTVNIFHPNPGSNLENMKAPTFEYVYEYARYLGRIYRKHDYIAVTNGFNRNSVDGELMAGMYEDTVDLEKIVLARSPGRVPSRGYNKPFDSFVPKNKILAK